MSSSDQLQSKTDSWSGRPGWARVLRVLLFLLPIGASVVVVLAATRLVERPSATMPTIAWLVGVTALGTLAMRATDRSLQRFVPVVTLLKLSLVFPDQAPSRFKLAIRQGTTRQLQRAYDADALDTTPQQAAESLLLLVSKLGEHDRLTRGHSERVRAYSDLIAEEMGLAQRDRELLHWAALLHDIGKLDVPEAILNKKGKPDDDEWATLRGHPAAAAAHLAPLSGWLGDWALAATQHHERWDGEGYPRGLAGEEISLAGRIVAVADAYDTMTSVRSYKTASTPEEARIELAHCVGGQFDPAVVRAFLAISVRRLRGVMGPIAWLSQLPVLLSAPVAIPAVTGAIAVTTVTATVAMSGALAPPPPVEQVVAAAPAELDLDLAFFEEATPTATLMPVVVDVGSNPAVSIQTATPTETPTPSATPPPGSTPTPTPTPTRTPTPPPGSTPTPTPTPTATPTVTPTSSPTPTPTPIPGVSTLHLTNPGSGDTVSSVVLPLSETAPAISSLPNYDTDRDSDEGLQVQKTGEGLSESDPTKYQLWSLDIGPQNLSGPATVRLRAAIKDYGQAKSATMAVRLQRCNAGLTSCTTLATGSKVFTQGGGSSFMTVIVNVTLSGDTTSAQPHLVLKVVAMDPSDDDVWLAYDTTGHDARIQFSG